MTQGRTMRGFLVDVKTGEARAVETQTGNGALADYYRLIGCKTIDITSRSIGGKEFDIICDDEGLYAEGGAIVSALDSKYRPALVGSLIVCNYDENTGENTSLTDEDIAHLQRHMVTVFHGNGQPGVCLLLDGGECENFLEKG